MEQGNRKMTLETYEYLTNAHGLDTGKCEICNKKQVEVYHDSGNTCYDCWISLCEPIITPPPE